MSRHPATRAAMVVFAAAAIAAAACSGSPSGVASLTGGSGGSVAAIRFTTPSPTPTPIVLKPGGSVGTQVYPDGDTSLGGKGKSKDGIPCTSEVAQTTPYLTQLTLIVNGEQIMVPKGSGMHGEGLKANFIYHATCFYYIHTHDHTGLIETEAPAG